MDEHAPIVYDLTPYKEETKSWDEDPSAYLLRYYTKYYFLATGGKELKQCPTQKIIDLQTGLQVLRGDQFIYQSPNKLCITGLAPTHPLIALKDRYKVLNIRFDPKIMGALPQPTSIPANSKKQPPPPCHSETVICKIEARDLLWEEEKNDGVIETVLAATATATGTVSVEPETNAPKECSGSASSSISKSTPSPPSTSGPVTDATQGQNKEKPKESVDPSRVIFVIRGAISGHVIELNERLLRRDTPEITDPVVIDTMLEKASTHGFIAVIRPKIDKTEVALKDLYTMEDYERLRRDHSAASVQ
ncbi:hypothetical protein EDD21DRAFT_372967 [Dissophora ornata]|nr:hypothetical protein BGZ58_010191 [Dissophora ornata]KAI8602033.1 hypothetical protein EDD21DRAFT_372967 [Dissophora ornata]